MSSRYAALVQFTKPCDDEREEPVMLQADDSMIRTGLSIHLGFGQTYAKPQMDKSAGDATSGRFSARSKTRGLTLANTFPLIKASGTGPYALESVELLRLSPANQT
jgi:hypothetical protein